SAKAPWSARARWWSRTCRPGRCASGTRAARSASACSGSMTMLSKLFKVAGIFSEALRDATEFLRFNSYSPFANKSQRAFYKILIEAHTIEKGLSLPNPKLLFGKDKVRFVMNALSRYDIGHSPIPAHMSLGALDAYVNFHAKAGAH